MKFLIIPSNNSLSHIAKGIALSDSLIAANHEAIVAVGRHHSKFIHSILDQYAVLPDIQETDGSPFPTLQWFKYQEKIISCIQSEMDLIKSYRPDAVIGIFRYTAKISTFFTQTPYYSLICGCMLPENGETLGFSENDPGHETQQFYLENFHKYATAKMNGALRKLDAPEVHSAKELLKGDRTFLWDFPEFMPLESRADVIHAGPISWAKWPYDDYDMGSFMNIPRPLAVVSFGTGIEQQAVTRRIASLLLDAGYKVVIANGRNGAPSRDNAWSGNCLALNFAPLQEILNHAAVLISHGGQMTVFEALNKQVPVVVMPFQPEQDHNGLCLERLSCGRRLVSNIPFSGHSGVYIEALDKLSDRDIISEIDNTAKDKTTRDRLSKISLSMAGYRGVETIIENIGEP